MYTKYLTAWFGVVVLGLVNATVRQVVFNPARGLTVDLTCSPWRKEGP